MYNRLSGVDVFQSVIQAACKKKFKNSLNRNRTYEVLVTSRDALSPRQAARKKIFKYSPNRRFPGGVLVLTYSQATDDKKSFWSFC